MTSSINSPSPRDLLIAVDPGLTGAIAVVGKTGELIAVADMPTVSSKTGKRKVDAFGLTVFMESFAARVALVVIEDVGPGTKEGRVGVFSFGFSTGVVHGVCGALMLPVHLMKPAVWKMALGLTRDKNLSVEMARKQYPKHADKFVRSKDGRAEAALIASFARRLL